MLTFVFIMLFFLAAPVVGVVLWLAGVIFWGILYGLISAVGWIFDAW